MNNKIGEIVVDSVMPKAEKLVSQSKTVVKQAAEPICPDKLPVSEIPAEVIRATYLPKSVQAANMSVEQLLEYFRKTSKTDIEAIEKMARFQAEKGSYDFKPYAYKFSPNGEVFYEGISHNANLMEGFIAQNKGVKMQKLQGNNLTYFKDEEGRIMLKCGDVSVQSYGDYARDFAELNGAIMDISENEVRFCIEHLENYNVTRINYQSLSSPEKCLNLKEVSKTVNINGAEVPMRFEGVGINIAEDGRIFKKELAGNDIVYTDLADLTSPPFERFHTHRIRI